MEPKLKLVRAKCGCDGCYFADKEDCPGDADNKFAACSENGEQKIFVIDEGEDNGTRV